MYFSKRNRGNGLKLKNVLQDHGLEGKRLR
jgi:hypothetical protein